MKSKILILLLLAFICITCQKENQAPTVEITSPTEGTEFVKGEKITISVDAKDGDGQIAEVRFYIDGKGVSSATGFPFTYEWSTENASAESHSIKATAVDDGNLEAEATTVVYINIYSPVLNTFQVKEVAQTSATCGGEVTESRGSSVKERGICWSENTNPKTSDNKKASGEGLGSFETTLEGLKQNTTYYVRAYAINDAGTSYGTQQSFTTTAVKTKPTVLTAEATNVNTNDAILGGNVTSDGYAEVTERGIVYSTKENPTTSNSKVIIGNNIGVFSATISGLIANTTYHVRAYAINSEGTVYGENRSFTTEKDLALPAVSTVLANEITTASAILGGNVTSDGNSPITERGIIYGLLENLDATGTRIKALNEESNFLITITGLSPNTIYYFKSYATNSLGTTYGKQESFTTSKVLSLATVTTVAAKDFTGNSATLGGNVTSDGNAPITERGIVYATSQNPTTANTKVISGSGTGTFSSNITGLKDNTTYYVRAYAINSQGTAYGDNLNFTTNKILSLATLTTDPATGITTTSAILGGNVTSDGNATVIEKGIVYNTLPNPTTVNTKIKKGSGLGSFNLTVTGLSPDTKYYVRTYAINSQGTAFGPEISFITNKVLSLATVTTSAATEITSNSAVLGGEVTSDGNSPVTERGIVYSTSHNPITSNTKIVMGNAIGAFNATVTNLNEGTTYYVRAFATNSKGTEYGNEISCKTEDIAGTFTDSRDGKVYKWVEIGTQTWMAENLAYLPSINTNSEISITKPYFYVAGYIGIPIQSASEVKVNFSSYGDYGALYNSPAALTVCPLGWHLPSDIEWEKLAEFISNKKGPYSKINDDWGREFWDNVGKHLKATNGWYDTGNGTDDFGYSALPGGFLHSYQKRYYWYIGFWWSSTNVPSKIEKAFNRTLSYDNSDFERGETNKDYGLSVRCIKN